MCFANIFHVSSRNNIFPLYGTYVCVYIIMYIRIVSTGNVLIWDIKNGTKIGEHEGTKQCMYISIHCRYVHMY